MVMIVPGFGLPHIETKRVILENNIKMFGKVPPDVIVCQYNGEQITFPNVKVYYKEGFVGQFLKEHDSVVYSANLLYVPSGVPCENAPPALLRDWSSMLRK